MAASIVPQTGPKQPDTEKITINLGFVDLGKIDLLVREGFYSNRTDLIRTAIRNELDRQQDAIRRSVTRRDFDMGLRRYTRSDLEEARAAGRALVIQVLGLVVISPDVTPELASETIQSITVLGALQAPLAVKAALQGRIH